jgi:hypothetical protein
MSRKHSQRRKRLQNIGIKENFRDRGAGISKCPVCGSPVRLMLRDGKHLDHYKPAKLQDGWSGANLLPVDDETAAKLHELRKGKKTVAMVGMAPTTCALAPFEDPDVEIWALNEMHAWSWLKRADRWFQIHHSDSFKRQVAKRDVHGHYDWLKENPLDIPIIMQYQHEEIPKSVGYPLREICDEFLGNLRRGDAKVKYFTSTLAYEIAYALYLGFERIELYGFEMSSGDEYIEQKGSAEFWMGIALGRGVELYLPDGCILLYSNLYGGDEQGAGWMKK